MNMHSTDSFSGWRRASSSNRLDPGAFASCDLGIDFAGALRLAVSHHFTFFINSLAHLWGRRPYSDEHTAVHNPVVALLT